MWRTCFGIRTTCTDAQRGKRQSQDEDCENTFAVTLAANQNENNKSRTIMTTLEIKGDWNITKGKLKQKWAKLTDDDWKLIGSKKDALVGKLQERYGHKKEAAEKEVDDYTASL